MPNFKVVQAAVSGAPRRWRYCMHRTPKLRKQPICNVDGFVPERDASEFFCGIRVLEDVRVAYGIKVSMNALSFGVVFHRNTRYSLSQLECWAEEGYRKPLDDLFRYWCWFASQAFFTLGSLYRSCHFW